MSESGSHEPDQIAGLESALTQRASKLAEEYHANARQEHEQILAAAKLRLQLDEERAVLAAKALAERAYQQQVQAAELELRAELDRLRMSLVNKVLEHIPARLAALAEDEQHYLPLLLDWLREGAQAIERDVLVAQVNQRDRQRLQRNWERYAEEAAPNKRLLLSAETLACSGGILVTSADGNIRLDNTFEGRITRLGEVLQNEVNEQLAAATREAQGG